MRNTQVAVYGRVKPCPQSIVSEEFDLRFGKDEDQILFSSFDKSSSKRKSFRFKKIFDASATQEQIFDAVAKPMIDEVLSGYNGLIFTFGQSGTGKTHTMAGDMMEPKNHGLISRAIKEIFQAKSNPITKVTYCEIYNERVRDLIADIDVESDRKRVSHFKNSKITMFRDLTVHKVETASEALELFIKGNERKTTAETEDGSLKSRSHVIFSIRLELPCTEDGILHLNPILYFVDFASNLEPREGPAGNSLETRSMNLSLLCLEHVLLTLRQPRKGCIPYRNSRITGFLKTTLGGNSLTAVIATFSLSINDIEQTIQTCQFAERVGQITNLAYPNEIIIPSRKIFNPSKDIELLQKQYKFLKAHLGIFLNNELPEDELDEDEKQICAALVQKFIAENNAVDLIDCDIRKTIFCFHLMRQEILQKAAVLDTPVELHLSDLSFMSNNDPLMEASKVSESKFREKSSERKSSIEFTKTGTPKENKSEQGIENIPPENPVIDEKSKSELKLPEAAAKNSESLFQKYNEEYVLVQKKIAGRSELVLCMVKSEGKDLLLNQSKSTVSLKM